MHHSHICLGTKMKMPQLYVDLTLIILPLLVGLVAVEYCGGKLIE